MTYVQGIEGDGIDLLKTVYTKYSNVKKKEKTCRGKEVTGCERGKNVKSAKAPSKEQTGVDATRRPSQSSVE